MSLLRHTQLAVKVEDYEGAYQAPVAADLIHVLASPQVDYDMAQIDRAEARGDLTMPLAVPSFRSGKLSFRVEPAGALAGIGTVPQIDTLLRSCGMRRISVKRVNFNPAVTPSAAIQHNATFVQATSNATGRFVGDRMPGDSYFFFEPLVGTVLADGGAHNLTVTNPDGSTATCAPATAGTFVLLSSYAWVPWNKMYSSIGTSGVIGGAGITNGDELVGGTSAAHGIARNSLAGAGTLTIERFLGSPHFVSGEQIQKASGTSNFVTANSVETQAEVPALTLVTPMDSTFWKAIKGSRGSWKATLRNGQVPVFDFDFTGCAVIPADASNLVWPGNVNKVPNVVTGGRFQLDVTYPPNFQELLIDYGNTVTLRQAPGDTTGTGYESCHITGRNSQGSIDPETIRESVWAFKAQNKAWLKTAFRMCARCGPGSDANTFEFWTRRAQIGTPKEGDREGLLVSSFPLLFRGDGNDEVIIFLS